jgi:hypothetical protein
MKNWLYKTALILTIVMASVSCVEIIDIELDSTYTRLVVYGTVTTDSLHHQVKLTTTSDYFFNEAPPPVTGADVTITFEDTTVQMLESEFTPGIYQPNQAFRGRKGVVYNLDITNVDIDEDGNYEIYSATAKMPEIAKADSITLQRFITPFFSGNQVALWSPDPPERNFYNYKLLINGNLLNRRLSEYTVQPDDFFNDNYVRGLPVGFLNDDEENELVLPGDTVTLEINSISEQYYNFIVEAQSEIFGNNPLFSGPPANVSSNIENGAVGIFTAYSIDRVSTIASIPGF